MWFKNLQLYRLAPDWGMTLPALDEALAKNPLPGCGGLDRQSLGWVSPRDDDQLVYAANGQWLICLGVEEKLLPASVVNQFAKDRARDIFEKEERRVGRKEMRELRERITEELLPRAFNRQRRTYVWIDPVNHWLAIDAAAQGKADEVIEQLRRTLEVFPLKPLVTEVSPVSAMTGWQAGPEAPAGFSLDQDLELRAPDEGKATVRYVRHALEGKEIQDHIANGKQATRLGMTWNDRISFVLTAPFQIKRLAFLDIMKEESNFMAESEEERFAQDYTLMTGELARMLADLVEALGGTQS